MRHPVVIIPAHCGHSGAPWPNGDYWLVEARLTGSDFVVYWADVTDDRGLSGWAFEPSGAAGFASAEEARSAYFARGPGAPGRREAAVEHVFVSLHEWVA